MILLFVGVLLIISLLHDIVFAKFNFLRSYVTGEEKLFDSEFLTISDELFIRYN
jgi:hypothetical protein